jgi:hypothetical protein
MHSICGLNKQLCFLQFKAHDDQPALVDNFTSELEARLPQLEPTPAALNLSQVGARRMTEKWMR